MMLIEFIGSFILILMAFIGHVGGTAGGGVVIPVLMIFYGLDTKTSIAISNFTVVFAAFTRFIMEYKKVNLVRGYGTIINYDYILLYS